MIISQNKLVNHKLHNSRKVIMKGILLIILLSVFLLACSNSSKNNADVPTAISDSVSSIETGITKENQKKNECKLVLNHVDNRVIIYINDSTIFDTGIVPGGPYEKEIDLTDLVQSGETDLRVELYNSNPTDETIKPGWMIVYDIFVNDELIDFIREKRNETKEGLVYTETHDLSDIW